MSSRISAAVSALRHMTSSTTKPTIPSNVDALVLGGGWAGLVAANRLVEANKSVVLVEARSRLGGRAFTHTYNEQTFGSSDRTVGHTHSGDKDTRAVDFGCSWIHGYREGNPVKGICEELGIPVSIAQPSASAIIGPDGRLPQDLTAKITANLAAAQTSAAFVARNTKNAPLASTTLADHLFAPDSQLFDGLASEAEKSLARQYARMLHVPLGTTIENVSLKWTAFEQNYAGTDAAPEGGFTRVIDALAAKFIEKGGVILKDHEVTGIQTSEQSSTAAGFQVRAKDSHGSTQELTSQLGLVTFPLAVLKQAHGDFFQPSLSERKKEVIDRVNVGDLNKILIEYPSAWWDKDIGTFTVLPFKSASSVNDDTSLASILASNTLIVSATANRLLVMIGGKDAATIEKFGRQAVVDALHKYLFSRLRTDPSAAEGVSPVHNFMSRWSGHALTGGATTTPVVVGEDTSPLDFVELSRPECSGRLGFAGEHTEINHRGSIAGAVISGRREADRMIALLDKVQASATGRL